QRTPQVQESGNRSQRVLRSRLRLVSGSFARASGLCLLGPSLAPRACISRWQYCANIRKFARQLCFLSTLRKLSISPKPFVLVWQEVVPLHFVLRVFMAKG